MTTGALREKVREQAGLRLSPEGIEVCGGGSVEEIIRNALDRRLKEVGEPFLAGMQGNMVPGLMCLQVVWARNLAQPTYKQDTLGAFPRMLGMMLSDGTDRMLAVETSHVKKIPSHQIAPGTKIVLQNCFIADRVLLVTEASFVRFCGQVASLKESWVMQNELMISRKFKSKLAKGEEQPPKFKPLEPSKIAPAQKVSSALKASAPAFSMGVPPTAKEDKKQKGKAAAKATGNRSGKASGKTAGKSKKGSAQSKDKIKNKTRDNGGKHGKEQGQKEDVNGKQKLKKKEATKPVKVEQVAAAVQKLTVEEHKEAPKASRAPKDHHTDSSQSKSSGRGRGRGRGRGCGRGGRGRGRGGAK